MLSLISLVLLFSVNTAFAYDAAKVNQHNSYIYGAWEGPGATESYREDVKGNNMNCSGETR